MTEPSDSDQLELKAKIEDMDPMYSPLGPGPYLYWFLAHHLKADEVEFTELFVDEQKSGHDTRSGRVFLVTNTGYVFVDYEDAVEHASSDPSQPFGTVTVTIYSKTDAPVESLKWAGRSLRIRKNQYGPGNLPARLERKSITVKGRGWTVELPARSIDGADEYFSRLRTALRLS